MKAIRLRVFYPEIDGVSDRTLREILKSISGFSRVAQIREVENLIAELALTRRQRQSLKDRLRRSYDNSPVYYLQTARAGSLELAVILTGVPIWLLQMTIGESVKEAWKLTESHKKILKYIRKDRERVLPDLLANEIRRRDLIQDRAKFSHLTISKRSKTIDVDVYIIPDEDLEVRYPNRITEKLLVENGAEIIRSLQHENIG